MKVCFWKALILILIVVQLSIAVLINYPPTEQQLSLLSIFSLGGNFSLWLLRFCSIGLLLWFLKIWKQLVGEDLYKWSALLLGISPAFFTLWYMYPFLIVKLLILTWFLNVIFSKKIKNFWFILMVLLGVVLFNKYVLLYDPAIFHKFSFKDAQREVTVRFVSEDSLLEKITLPLWWRRAAYNKYFFTYKEIVGEILPYFDLETLFFQETPPTEQKSMVMWYWPEIYVFVIGIYFCLNKKYRDLNKKLWLLLGISIIDFIFSEGQNYLRHLTTMLPISIVMAIAWKEMITLARKKYLWANICSYLIGILLFFSFVFNFYDLKSRKEYWFDNRPLAFEFWFNNIKKIGIDNYSKIYVSSIVGDSKIYCKYYFGKLCQEKRWVFKSFDLTEKNDDKRVIYAGFAGEFVGPRYKNDLSAEWKEEIKYKGIILKDIKNLRDTIANQYGNEVAVGVKND